MELSEQNTEKRRYGGNYLKESGEDKIVYNEKYLVENQLVKDAEDF